MYQIHHFFRLFVQEVFVQVLLHLLRALELKHQASSHISRTHMVKDPHNLFSVRSLLSLYLVHLKFSDFYLTNWSCHNYANLKTRKKCGFQTFINSLRDFLKRQQTYIFCSKKRNQLLCYFLSLLIQSNLRLFD